MKRPFPVRWPGSRLTAVTIGSALLVFVWVSASPGKLGLRGTCFSGPVGGQRRKCFVCGGQPRLGAGPWRSRRTSEAGGWQKNTECCVLILLHAPSFASFVPPCPIHIFAHKGPARRVQLTNWLLRGRRVAVWSGSNRSSVGTTLLPWSRAEFTCRAWSVVFSRSGSPSLKYLWLGISQNTVNVWCGLTRKCTMLLFWVSTWALQLECVASSLLEQRLLGV